jgi:carboxypeptidase Taq
MTGKYQELVVHLQEITNLNRAGALLGWDQRTQMPPGGAAARGRQLATLARLSHEMFTDEKTLHLLDDAAKEIDGLSYDSDEASLLRVVRQDYEDLFKLPAAFVAEMAEVTTLAHPIWAQARAENNFAVFQPMLERIVELVKQSAEYLGYADHPYDALLGQFERGMKAAEVKTIFDAHKPALVDLIARIRAVSDRVSDAVLHQPFEIDKQRQFAMEVVRSFGYDFDRGRLDETVHPFATSFSRDDVRITTRFLPEFLNPALFGTMHEAGHAMYEQGIAPELDATPLGGGTSLSVHESQSRMWENIVGRSKPFWAWALPKLQAVFPQQLGGVDLDTFYKAINIVKPSYIRVEADEATYNLHIMLRFELEMELAAGKVKVADLPQEWNDRFEASFGIRPPTDAVGVLQDIHWSGGMIGYFPTYALGNLLSAQYYNQAIREVSSIPDDIASGRFDTLLGWLNDRIHRHGRKFTADELTRRITGEGIQSRDYIAYLETKYAEVYGL